MENIPQPHLLILKIFLERGKMSSSEVHEKLRSSGGDVSLITVKRELSLMKNSGLIVSSGAGRSVKYNITTFGRINISIDAHVYNQTEPDTRYGLKDYNFELFDSIHVPLLSVKELAEMEHLTLQYRKRVEGISGALKEKELERFIIELSWKSSKIEGNTYTLLDTEKLILEGKEASGHDRKEAQMILNHKDAFKFIRSNSNDFRELTLPKVEEIHKILVKDMDVNFGLRSSPVGVTGSIYRPLDNVYQIREAMGKLSKAVSRLESSYEKSLLTTLGLSYIQPFEDGNKRTSRLMANAVLLAYDRAPLSYRSVNEDDYREAVLVFYELNSMAPFKQIFIDQYRFAANNYLIGN